MRMSWRVAWLSWVVGLGEALGAEGPPHGGFPAEGVEFLVVSPGYAVCLSLSRGGATPMGAGRPCEWEAPGAEQRWRYHAGRLVNVASGECLFSSAPGPCEETEPSRVSYELLLQRLVVQTPRAGAGCLVVDVPGRGGDGAAGELMLGLAPLDARECGAEHVASKWMLVPL